MREPFAVELYRRAMSGESAEEISHETGIPLDRVQQRLRAAEVYLRQAGRAVAGRATKRAPDTD